MNRPLPCFFLFLCKRFWAGLFLLLSGWPLLLAQADNYRLERLSSDCCYRFGYDQLPPSGPITRLDLELTAAGARFSEIATELSAGWTYQISPDRRRLEWSWSAFALPATTPSLFDFCIAGLDTETTELVVSWRSGPVTIQVDTLELSCAACTQLETLTGQCSETGVLSYEFRYRNSSTFRVDHLRILEPPGQDLILVDRIDLPTGVLPGGLSDSLSLPLDPAAEGLPELCFELVASRTLPSGESVACCYQRYCLTGPVCDRCCTAEADFVADVERGFEWTQDTPDCLPFAFTLRPRSLGDCDFIQWRIRVVGGNTGLGTTTNGMEPASFTVSDADSGLVSVAVEMRVRRTDLSGKACYTESWRVYRDTIDCLIATVSFSTSPIKLWPNPATRELHLAVPFAGAWSVRCFDVAGRHYPLELKGRSQAEYQFSLTALPPGLYFLQLRSPTGVLLTRKFYKLN